MPMFRKSRVQCLAHSFSVHSDEDQVLSALSALRSVVRCHAECKLDAMGWLLELQATTNDMQAPPC